MNEHDMSNQAAADYRRDDSSPDNAVNGSAAAPKQPRRIGRTVILGLLSLFAMLVLLVAGIFAAAHTERGTRAIFRIADKLSAGRIHAQWVAGNLAHGGSAEQLQVHLTTVHIDIENLSGQWRWQVFPLHWRVPLLAADRLDVALYPSDEPSRPLQKITLPFAITGEDVRVGTFNLIQGEKTTTMSEVQLRLDTDKVNHRIELTHLQQGSATYAGKLDVKGIRPFPMTGQFTVQVNDDKNDFGAQMTLAGDLKRLTIGMTANAQADSANRVEGKGDVQLQLLDGLYVHQGLIDFHHLDPKLFWSSLPSADLDINLTAKPNTPVSSTSPASSARQPVEGNWSLTNHRPLTLSELGIPVLSGQGGFSLTDEHQNLHDIAVQLLDGGIITGAGTSANRQGTIDLTVRQFSLKTIHPKMLATALNGTVQIDINPDIQRYQVALAQNDTTHLHIDGDVSMHKGGIDIQSAKISGLGDSFANFVGKIQTSEKMPLRGQLQVKQFNLHDLGDFPSSQLMGQFSVDGELRPQVVLNIKGDLQQSRWGNVGAGGQVDFTYHAPDRIEARTFDVQVGDNRISAKGGLGQAGEHLSLNLNAPNLAQLQFGFAGALTANGDLSGSITKPRGRLNMQGSQLAFFDNHIQALNFNGQWESGDNGALNAQLQLSNYAVGPVNLQQAQANLTGTQAIHQFNARFTGTVHVLDGKAGSKPVQWLLDTQTAGNGGITRDGWRGQISQLNNIGQPNIHLAQAVQLAYENKAFSLNNLIANVQDAQLNVRSLTLQGARIDSQGSVNNLVANRWLSWLALNLPFFPSDDFALRGQWDIAMGTSPRGGFRFERERGNVALDERRRNLIELSDLNLQGNINATQMALSGALNGPSIGENRVSGNIGLVNSPVGWVISGLSPLNLNVKARLNQLRQFNQLFGVNVRIDGQAQADVDLTGTLSAWTPRGTVNGQNLSFYHVEEGLRLSDGVARLRIEPNRIVFEQFDLKGLEGTLSVNGVAGWGIGEQQGVNATMKMDHLRPFARPDREVVLSGAAQLGFDGQRLFSVKGDITVDRGLIDMPPTFPPSLGSDVHFVAAQSGASAPPATLTSPTQTTPSSTKPTASALEISTPTLANDVHIQPSSAGNSATAAGDKATTVAPHPQTKTTIAKKPTSPHSTVGASDSAPPHAATTNNHGKTTLNPAYAFATDVNLDFGRNFRFKGHGADVFMTGQLRVHSEADNPELRVNGTVRIARGTYLFYGQTLTVQRGLVTFSGPMDDPSINIAATRTIEATEVGAEISGTLANTRVRLTSNPDMPDEEKLAWLLFGRSTKDLSNSDVGAVAGAASLLLSSDQGKKITDKFGIDSVNVGATGTTNTKGNTGTYVGVGKQFSDRFGVAYEQGIDTISSVLRMTWSISRNWQVILRGGTANGLDLQYRKRFDRLSFGSDAKK